MRPHATEALNLERQVALARPIFLVLALVVVLEMRRADSGWGVLLFLGAYLGLSLPFAVWQGLERSPGIAIPFWLDLGALAVFLVITRSVVPFWFLYLFVAFAAGIRWTFRRTVVLTLVITLAVMVRTVLREPHNWQEFVAWIALAIGTFTSGAGIGFLGAVQRQHAGEHETLARLTGMLRVEHGMSESIRMVLAELLRLFNCEEALLVYRDADLERLFVWRLKRGQAGRLTPESLPFEKSDAFFMDDMDASICWNNLEGAGEGFAWDRRTGRPLHPPPRLPGPSRREFNVRSLLASTFEHRDAPVGRFLLLNGARPFSRFDLRWLDRISRNLGAAIENVYLLRQIRARAIESERTRIAHDLHDGILQTLLSAVIQLDVLHRRLPAAPDRVATDLVSLRQTLRHESEELRRIVTDLRPLHVESADLLDLMRGYADRFRNESTILIDLLLDTINVDLPDRICRELFQIYRECLNNIKKHANATHVVVKLWQDEDKVTLVVDDNGQGFSFAGRFSREELDRLRLGPISIKERARGIGGSLTVESSPGHGARVIVEVPVS